MEQGHNPATRNINASDVWPLVLITVQTTPGKVLQFRFAAMLLGDDVVYLERKRVKMRGDSAVITSVAR
jgi:hypothetical protein